MTDYYTTQSLATAAAAIEQGFKGCWSLHHFLWQQGFIPEATGACNKNAAGEYVDGKLPTWRFPKTPHNVELMKKIIGDILMVDPTFWGSEECKKIEKFPPETITAGLGQDIGFPRIFNIIISRPINGKQNPFPVWDKEEA